MKNYHKSDYALNKYRKGIVYKFADGIVEVKLEDYLRENPDKTEADFQALKRLSDEWYLEQVRLETALTNGFPSTASKKPKSAQPVRSMTNT